MTEVFAFAAYVAIEPFCETHAQADIYANYITFLASERILVSFQARLGSGCECVGARALIVNNNNNNNIVESEIRALKERENTELVM